MFNPYDIVYTVLITEKATAAAESQSRYAFKVNPRANKIQIAQAVRAIFEDVEVASVNVMNYLGKKKRMRSAKMGKRSDWKKAIVKLKSGSIELL